MNLYYEINKGLAEQHFGGVVYWSQRNVGDYKSSLTAMQYSDRVWEESNGVVKYAKNRFWQPKPEVDKEEFMCVKLKSKELVK